jgi:hypothetical protein
MSNVKRRGCAYTSSYSPGFLFERKFGFYKDHDDRWGYANNFICNHALDIY